MQCPACKHELSQTTVGNVTVDACVGGCAGIWFDNFELKKIAYSKDHSGEQLLDLARDINTQVDLKQRRKCPVCPNMLLMQHYYSPDRKVTVDECPNCAGIWLDTGELSGILSMYGSEEEAEKSAEAYYSELFDGTLTKMKEESEQKYSKAKSFANLFRFICPSYYLPGKQKWGAF